MPSPLSAESISALIYRIRGQKVMLDRDLALLYQVETKVLKQAVRRNINRFPQDFMFEITLDEDRSLRSQTVALKRGRRAIHPVGLYCPVRGPGDEDLDWSMTSREVFSFVRDKMPYVKTGDSMVRVVDYRMHAGG